MQLIEKEREVLGWFTIISYICGTTVRATTNSNNMKSNNLPNGMAGARSYVPPVCKEFYVGAQSIICASETEIVGETEGEW